uniref:Ribosomal protein S19 n=1 Tax=Ichthyophthirius multifiliis TaxID=5932 RepID=G1FLB3_ICHMU|nr:ribosomal protein S19 [Ichthyophthirius multifiliis]AEL89255.1 ribosomal protein S19 [Ichthyophthirius multifiliis]
MGRSNWRLNFISKSVLSRVLKYQLNIKVKIRDLIIINKSSSIPEYFDKVSTLIYKGSRFRYIKINKYLTGWKFGEFSITRKPNVYLKKPKNKSNKLSKK